MTSLYDFTAKAIDGTEVSLTAYRGQVTLVVNTASKCGFTPQFKGLEALYASYKERGFSVLGFPCNQFMHQDPGSDAEISSFCEMNHGVTFPMFAKIDVNGEAAHPLFKYLASEAPGLLGSKAIKWNFTKFLVDRQGQVLRRYAPTTEPSQIASDIEALL